MSKYRKIDVRIWNDAKFRDLSHNAKLVFFFLLTHPNMTALGAMRSTLSGLAEELDFELEVFREAFREAFAKGMVKHDSKACLIALPNFIKYNQPESPNVVKAWVNSLDLLPECDLKNDVISLSANALKGYSKAFREALPEAFLKTYPKSMPNQEQEQEQEQEQDLNKKENAGEDFQKKDESHLYVAPTRRTYSLFDEWKPEPELWKETLKRSAHLVKPEQFTKYTLLEFIRLNVGKGEKMESEWQKFYVNAIARGYIKPEGQEAKPTNQPEPAIDYTKPQNLIKPIIYEYDPEERARQSAEMKRIRKEQGR
jgi:hypothetical protein